MSTKCMRWFHFIADAHIWLVAAGMLFLLLLLCTSFINSSCPIGEVQSAQGDGCIEVKSKSSKVWDFNSILLFDLSENATWIKFTVSMQRLGAFYLEAHNSLAGGAMLRSGPQTSTSRFPLVEPFLLSFKFISKAGSANFSFRIKQINYKTHEITNHFFLVDDQPVPLQNWCSFWLVDSGLWPHRLRRKELGRRSGVLISPQRKLDSRPQVESRCWGYSPCELVDGKPYATWGTWQPRPPLIFPLRWLWSEKYLEQNLGNDCNLSSSCLNLDPLTSVWIDTTNCTVEVGAY